MLGADPTGYSFSPDPSTFEQMFTYVDEQFIPKVQAVDAVIRALSPATRTLLDECGTDMDSVLNASLSPPADSPRYWVAAGAYFAYLYGRVVALPNCSVDVVGHSQLMDGPGQEPSVTLLDWTSGVGTAAYWATWLLIRAFALGDLPVAAKSSDPAVFALAFAHTSAPGRPDLQAAPQSAVQRVLLVNKANSAVTVSVLPEGPAARACEAWTVDEASGMGPPRQSACLAGGAAQLELAPFATAVVQLTPQ